MRHAIRLARRGQGLTHPNPMVGAVIVKNGKIVGSGCHNRFGKPHAEINALRKAGRAARGATLYVTLEPCNHFGKTPPCTHAIIESGIRHVVIAMEDPNPITKFGGIRRLKSSGIRITLGVMAAEAREINRPFEKYITGKMPFVTLKIAQSLDGKIATKTGESKWITGEDARNYVHKLRANADAVMVGVNTVIKDDPRLVSKLSSGRQPRRIVVDTNLKTPLNSRLFSGLSRSDLIIATSYKINSPRADKYRSKGASLLFVRRRNRRVDLRDLLRRLAAMGMLDIIVEGGSQLGAGLIEERLCDRLLFFIAPKIIGGKEAVSSIGGRGIKYMKEAVKLCNMKIKRFSKDILIETEIA